MEEADGNETSVKTLQSSELSLQGLLEAAWGPCFLGRL